MIRDVNLLGDVDAITGIYNDYVLNSTATFETTPIDKKEMQERISQFSTHYPYLVYEVNGEVAGFCYAHPWKMKAAYQPTLETTVYLSPQYIGQGIGRQLMQQLIQVCKNRGYRALIACITEDNERSIAFHQALGFKQVSHFEHVGMKFGHWIGVKDYELLL